MQFNKLGIAKRMILASKFNKAKRLLIPMANKMHSKSQLILGYLYFGGDMEMSRKESKFWLEKAARQGEADAMTMLATTNFSQGSWSNIAESKNQIIKVERAAKKGSAEAQRWLASTYAQGEVVPVDYEKVVYWDTKAAENGLSESQHDLGVMWMTGEAGSIDINKSLYWYKRCVHRDYNVIEAERAFKKIIEIHEGKFGDEFKDLDQISLWKQRAEHFLMLPYRNHPDWFYGQSPMTKNFYGSNKHCIGFRKAWR